MSLLLPTYNHTQLEWIKNKLNLKNGDSSCEYFRFIKFDSIVNNLQASYYILYQTDLSVILLVKAHLNELVVPKSLEITALTVVCFFVLVFL